VTALFAVDDASFIRFRFPVAAGWTDDTQLSMKQRGAEPGGEGWSSVGGAYTTGRRGRPARQPPLPLIPPGKLNMAEYNNVSAALSRLQVLFLYF
jgi:hypothetical protein